MAFTLLGQFARFRQKHKSYMPLMCCWLDSSGLSSVNVVHTGHLKKGCNPCVCQQWLLPKRSEHVNYCISHRDANLHLAHAAPPAAAWQFGLAGAVPGHAAADGAHHNGGLPPFLAQPYSYAAGNVPLHYGDPQVTSMLYYMTALASGCNTLQVSFFAHDPAGASQMGGELQHTCI